MKVNPKWTLAEALAEHQRVLENDASRSDSEPNLPLYQWAACHDLEHLQKAFAGGDKFALMRAIRICANHDLPMPEWTSKAYIKAYDAVVNAREKSWDVVFGPPYPKGANLSALRKRRMLMFAVRNRVSEIRKAEPAIAIDEGLFARVGKEFNIGKTLAAEYYYHAKRISNF